ncbi:MAG: HlyC/CorC family transporter [Cyanobacteria bacterium Co-bin13]|nr:HlyC/CorC family transporter [Cyanobacteria bacterium Co-bin13]
MTALGIEPFLILILIIANGIFSGSEIALVSARKVRLEQQSREGNPKARLALRLAQSPNDFLSTVQIGITLIGISSGALGGATVAGQLRGVLDQVVFLRPYSDMLSFAIVVGLLTYLSLVIGELVPKRLALSYPEAIACGVARPMQRLSRLAAPLVALLSFSTDTVVRLMGIRATEETSITEDELRVLIEQGTEAGTFEASEQEMFGRVLRLGDRPIRALMTPRTDVDWINLEASIDENRELVLESPHSRFPVCRGSIDDCLGVVRLRSLLQAYLYSPDPHPDLLPLLQTPLYVADSTRALKVLEMFKESGTHIALVLDEYGGLEGLVTLNDLVEAIVGDLPAIEDEEEPMVVQREDGSWLLDGLLSVDELKRLLLREELPDEEGYHTLAGFVINQLGRIPTAGDYFEWQGMRFEVVDMDGRRIDKVLMVGVPVAEMADKESHDLEF